MDKAIPIISGDLLLISLPAFFKEVIIELSNGVWKGCLVASSSIEILVFSLDFFEILVQIYCNFKMMRTGILKL